MDIVVTSPVIDPPSHGGADLSRRSASRPRSRPRTAESGRLLGCTGYWFRWGQGFPFQRFSFVRHLAPTAGQIEVRYSKDIIGCLSSATAALVGSLPTFVS